MWRKRRKEIVIKLNNYPQVDLGPMAINGYSAFPKDPALLEPHH